MKGTIISIILIVGTLIVGFLLWVQPHAALIMDTNTRQYHGHGISFSYPAHYFLEEKETGNAERTRYSVVLTEDTEENKAVREGRAPGREGPTAITLDIFQNDLDHLTAEEWIKGVADSNFKLSPDSILTPRTVGGVAGLRYHWSGLYEARSFAVAQGSFIYSFTATYLTSSDQILTDFESTLGSVKFD